MFQPYAKYWLPGLTQLIVSGNHGGEGMHYFVVDLMVTMLSWTNTAILEVSEMVTMLSWTNTAILEVRKVCKHCH